MVEVGNKLIAVVGATASGKTALAVALAQEFEGELVSADAKQVYRGMDIGTAKEKNLPVPQHLLDFKQPGEKITVAQYQQLAYQCIDRLIHQRKLPIIVGGSGLYIESVIQGYIFDARAKSQQQQSRYDVLKLGISWSKEKLHQRLQARTQQWVEEGIVEEIKSLLNQGVPAQWLESCGLEYRYFTYYVQGKLSLEEAMLKTNTSQRQFVKRQYTWWRRHLDLHWVQDEEEAKQLVKNFLLS